MSEHAAATTTTASTTGHASRVHGQASEWDGPDRWPHAPGPAVRRRHEPVGGSRSHSARYGLQILPWHSPIPARVAVLTAMGSAGVTPSAASAARRVTSSQRHRTVSGLARDQRPGARGVGSADPLGDAAADAAALARCGRPPGVHVDRRRARVERRRQPGKPARDRGHAHARDAGHLARRVDPQP